MDNSKRCLLIHSSECPHRQAHHRTSSQRQFLAVLLQNILRPLTCSFSSSPMNSGLRTSTLVLNCRHHRQEVVTGSWILSDIGSIQQMWQQAGKIPTQLKQFAVGLSGMPGPAAVWNRRHGHMKAAATCRTDHGQAKLPD